jgi:hypothetical protein
MPSLRAFLRRMIHARLWALFALALCAPAVAVASEAGEIWLQIDTGALELKVMRGDQVVQVFEDIAIGRSGTTKDKRRMDGKTPLGEFRISLVKNNSGFYRFFGFDYPRLDQADRALQRGDLPVDQYVAIRQAVRGRRTPPQNTALGGHLGIHGIGSGDPQVHEDYNWTNGCVALTNAQIDALTRWVRLGTRVVIY